MGLLTKDVERVPCTVEISHKFESLHAHVRFNDGSVIHPGDAVTVLPYDPEHDRVVMIEQFRAGAFYVGWDAWMIEIVAGIVDEGEEALDVAVEQAGGTDAVKAAVVYQKDDYGADGLDGWKRAAAFHGVKLVAEGE